MSANIILSNYGEVTQNVYRYEWKIKNFFDCCKIVGESMSSPDFSCGNNNEFKWRLELYPFGNQEEDEGYLSIYLTSLNDYNLELTREFIIFRSLKKVKHTKVSNVKYKPNESRGCSKFIKRNDIVILELITNDYLQLSCEISSIKTFTDFSNHSHGLKRISDTKLDVLNDFKKLFKNDDFCDVTINVNGKEFRAHKAILAARSTVFTAMFKCNMIEKETNSVKIEDINHEIFEEMLKYIYTGEVNNIKTTAKALLVVADKYALSGLKTLCTLEISKTVNIENAIDLLMFAETYNVDTLKNNIIDFIAINVESIINVPEFELLENATPKIFMEIIRKLALHKKK